jgi:hypothetical protein
VAETLVEFQEHVVSSDGVVYEARACGAPMPGGTWQGWIEFIPLDGGDPIRSKRETTQPNRADTVYWATGLTPVYLEGALKRALDQPFVAPVHVAQPSVFDGPAPSTVPASVPPEAAPTSILDPFSIYEKGEAMLRRQLSALSAWHLVNIALEYELTDLSVETLNRLPAKELIELIVRGVQEQTGTRST